MSNLCCCGDCHVPNDVGVVSATAFQAGDPGYSHVWAHIFRLLADVINYEYASFQYLGEEQTDMPQYLVQGYQIK